MTWKKPLPSLFDESGLRLSRFGYIGGGAFLGWVSGLLGMVVAAVYKDVSGAIAALALSPIAGGFIGALFYRTRDWAGEDPTKRTYRAGFAFSLYIGATAEVLHVFGVIPFWASIVAFPAGFLLGICIVGQLYLDDEIERRAKNGSGLYQVWAEIRGIPWEELDGTAAVDDPNQIESETA